MYEYELGLVKNSRYISVVEDEDADEDDTKYKLRQSAKSFLEYIMGMNCIKKNGITIGEIIQSNEYRYALFKEYRYVIFKKNKTIALIKLGYKRCGSIPHYGILEFYTVDKDEVLKDIEKDRYYITTSKLIFYCFYGIMSLVSLTSRLKLGSNPEIIIELLENKEFNKDFIKFLSENYKGAKNYLSL